MASNNSNNKNPRPSRPIDPLLQQRLQQLSSRRPGASLPPPEATARPGVPARTARTAGATATAARPGKRTKPARGSKAASLALSVATTAGLAALFANQDTPTESVVLTSGTVAPVTTTAATATPVTTGSTGTSATTATTPTTAAPAPAAGAIVDGTYLGAGSRNRWGTVQVQAVYSGGQLVDVQIVQYPDGDRKSLAISQRALPTLINQAIGVQSASVDGVSGATYTSRSYVQSLQSAIDAAKVASGIA